MNDWPGRDPQQVRAEPVELASRSAFEDSEMPSTATIDATPIAIPSADSAARTRRVRRPSAPVRSTSRGGHTSAPSRISTRRGNASAIAWSCVIVTIVEPAACSSCSSARMPAPVRVSRLPVGSSANRIAGPPDERPRDRHPLALAAGQLRRRCVEPVLEPDRVQRLARPRAPLARRARRRRAARSRRCRARSSRRAGRTAGTRTRSRARAAPPARARRASAVSSPVDLDRARARALERPHHVQQRRLARAGRPDDRDRLARVAR